MIRELVARGHWVTYAIPPLLGEKAAGTGAEVEPWNSTLPTPDDDPSAWGTTLLDIAMTLVGDPRVIFLDEPTTGLDPRSRHTMWQIIRELVGGGVTVFLTTQYLEEADQPADRVAVLHDGRIAAEGTTGELKRLLPGGHVRLRFTDPASYREAAATLGDAARDDEAPALRLPADGSQRDLRAVLDRLDTAGVEADELTVHTPYLDDVFFALTGGAVVPHPSGRSPNSRIDRNGQNKETAR